MKEFSRRDFLKLGAAGLASLMLGGSTPENMALPALPEKPIRKEQGVLFIMPSKSIDEDVKIFEEAVGHRVQGLSFFADLDKKLPRQDLIEKSFDSGRTVMINLQPRPTLDPNDIYDIFAPRNFVAGKHDETLAGIANMMAEFDKTSIYIRFAFEMNGNWFNWGGNSEGYKKMWRHTIDVFRKEGANNVKWIFSPGYNPYPETVGNYYPGSSYVDLVGADIYDWEGFSPPHAINRINYYLKQIAPDKPLIVGELGSSGKYQDTWVTNAIRLSLGQGASAINYFQINKEKEWKIEAGKVPKLRKLIDTGVFLGNDASLESINRTIMTVN